MKKALLLIDMQNGYFDDPALATEKSRLVSSQNYLLRQANAANTPIIIVRTEHELDGSTWTLGMQKTKQGFMLRGTKEAAIVDGLEFTSCHEVIKTRDSAFWQTDLLTYLRQKTITHLVLAGVSTHACITQTAIDAYNADLQVEVAKEGVASNKPNLHDVFLEFIRDEYGIEALSNQAIEWSK